MHIILSESFLKSAAKLPLPIKDKLRALLELLKVNPEHPLLHVKKLTGGLQGHYSFRITRDFRAMFYTKNSTTIYMVKVANRKDIYR